MSGPRRAPAVFLAAVFLVAASAAWLAGCGGSSEAPAPLGIGDRLQTDLHLPDLAGARPAVRELLGGKATVFYAWSVPCPCVTNAEARVQALVEAYGADVRWIAVAGEPLDTAESLREQKLRLGSPYRVLRDPQQALCRLLGFTSATTVALLDGRGALVYRGPLDDDYAHGKGAFLTEALDALLAGKPVPTPERPPTYGCDFNDPSSCRRPKSEGGASR